MMSGEKCTKFDTTWMHLRKNLEFPELKRAAYEKYWEYEPDQMIVEAKAAGSPLILSLELWEYQSRSLRRLVDRIKLQE